MTSQIGRVARIPHSGYTHVALVTHFDSWHGYIAVSNSAHHGRIMFEPLDAMIDRGRGDHWFEDRPRGLSLGQAVRSARRLMTYKSYSWAFYNCEHFLYEICEGYPRSPQLQRAVASGVFAFGVGWMLKRSLSEDDRRA